MYERTVVVLHEGSLAHFRVVESEQRNYTVRLEKYQGRLENSPPEQFSLRQVGRRWEDDGFDQELADEIGKAIELSQRTEQPVDPDLARRWGSEPNL